jgi:hypothetical protein
MIIDFHTHVFSPEIIAKRSEYLKHEPVLSELYSDPKAKMTDAEDLLKALSEQQVDYAVMQNLQWRQPDICHISNDTLQQLSSAIRINWADSAWSPLKIPGKLYVK